MNVDMPNPEQLRDIINTSKEPIIFCNILNWNILNWNLADWNRELGEEELHARCGKNLRTIVCLGILNPFVYLCKYTHLRNRNGKGQQKT